MKLFLATTVLVFLSLSANAATVTINQQSPTSCKYSTMNGDSSGNIVFQCESIASNLFNVTVVQSVGGTITTSNNTAAESTQVTVNAAPLIGYSFASWGSALCNGQGMSCSFVMPKNDVVITAKFSNNPSDSCGQTPANAVVKSLSLPYPQTTVKAAPSSVFAFKFTPPQTTSTASVKIDVTRIAGSLPGKEVVVSTCPASRTEVGPKCAWSVTDSKQVIVYYSSTNMNNLSDKYCVLESGKPYYVNVFSTRNNIQTCTNVNECSFFFSMN